MSIASVMRPSLMGWSRLATVVLVSAFLAFATPGDIHAADGTIKLALTPVGQAGSYFDLTMRPGETRSLQIDIANDGATGLTARTYAADVYTIIDGGFGGRLRDAPQTATTRWLDYPTEVLDLSAGRRVRRPVTVAVPASTGPGEYATSIVLENDRPIRGDGAVVLDQVIRQAVAIVVTVPGPRTPGLAIGEATHIVIAGRSVVSIAVENSGNVRLKPIVSFAVFDAAGYQVSQATVPMDTFYARTATSVEFPLATLLTPGSYTVRLTLDDRAQGVRAERPAIVLVVEAQPEATSGGGADLTELIQIAGDGWLALPLWIVIVGCGALGLTIGFLVLAVRRRQQAGTLER